MHASVRRGLVCRRRECLEDSTYCWLFSKYQAPFLVQRYLHLCGLTSCVHLQQNSGESWLVVLTLLTSDHKLPNQYEPTLCRKPRRQLSLRSCGNHYYRIQMVTAPVGNIQKSGKRKKMRSVSQDSGA